jgi:hypothetical protein
MNGIWIFQAEYGQFPCAIFSNNSSAFMWIAKLKASGQLTWYPTDISVYDWAVKEGHFQSKWERHHTSEFIQRFTSNSQPHYHWENGEKLGGWEKKIESIENEKTEGAWIFQAEKERISSAVFSNEETAVQWIHQVKASGILTWYPSDMLVYDWSVKNGFFKPKYESQKQSEFMLYFTSAAQPHSHWENGM